MTLPPDPRDWKRTHPDAWDALLERAALVWEGQRDSTEADWPMAKLAAVECVRREWKTTSGGLSPPRPDRRSPG